MDKKEGECCMGLQIKRVIEDMHNNGVHFQLVEISGGSYMILMNGQPGCHASDLDRVRDYMHSMVR